MEPAELYGQLRVKQAAMVRTRAVHGERTQHHVHPAAEATADTMVAVADIVAVVAVRTAAVVAAAPMADITEPPFVRT